MPLDLSSIDNRNVAKKGLEMGRWVYLNTFVCNLC